MFQKLKKPDEEASDEEVSKDEVLTGKVKRLRYMGDKPIRLSFRLESQDGKTAKFYTVLPSRSPTAMLIEREDLIRMTITRENCPWPWPMVLSCEIEGAQTEEEDRPLRLATVLTGEVIGQEPADKVQVPD